MIKPCITCDFLETENYDWQTRRCFHPSTPIRQIMFQTEAETIGCVEHTQHKTLEYFLKIQYPIVIEPLKNGGYVAKIERLKGCIAMAETQEEALRQIQKAKIEWTKIAYENGEEIDEGAN